MAAEFIAEEGLLKGLILSLEEGEKWTIGRDPDQCDIVIEDPKVSRKALICRKSSQGYFVENLSETNPILVNDNPIYEPVLLHEEDKIVIGSSVFRFYLRARSSFYFAPEGDQEPFEDAFTEEEELPQKKEELKTFEEQAPLTDETLEEEPLYEEKERETIFGEEIPEFSIDLSHETRFLLKVIAGPNTGAEFALEMGRSYLIGTDTSSCDVIFNDLSVSREHARLSVSKDGILMIEDLNSRNGVIVDRQRIVGKAKLDANAVIALGTSAFLLIDREAPSETIAAAVFETPQVEEKEEVEEEEKLDEKVSQSVAVKKTKGSAGAFVLSLFIAGLAVLFGIGIISLLKTEKVETVKHDYQADIQAILKDFPAVRYTYNKSNQKLFLMGHVQTGIQHNELLYRLRGLSFITGVEDNIVNDEAVWQDMNILLSKHPDFKGVSMHSSEPGVFVLSGYLQTEKQASALSDYMNVHFNYLSLLQNRVVVEQQISEQVASNLVQNGFAAVNVAFTNGELQLTGYVSSTQSYEFEKLLAEFKKIPGMRSVKNFVVAVSPEQGVIDLNRRYPGRYRVTGYSKHGDMNINVVINGRILTRGDNLDGMTITSIQPHTIFLEKDGLKYKIEYNK